MPTPHVRPGSLSARILLHAHDHDTVTVAEIAAAINVKAPTYEYMAVPQTFLRLRRRGMLRIDSTIANKSTYRLTGLGRAVVSVLALKEELRAAETDVHTGGKITNPALAATKDSQS